MFRKAFFLPFNFYDPKQHGFMEVLDQKVTLETRSSLAARNLLRTNIEIEV